MLIINIIFQAALCILVCYAVEDKEFWQSIAKEELDKALKLRWNEGKAKNVIIFIGDGMGISTLTAARIYKGGEQSKLTFETFPHIGLIKTYSTDTQVPDSACTATAIFSGVKTNNRILGLQSTVQPDNCKESLNKNNHLDNIFDWGHSAGKKTGFVTTTRVTHATPAATYAHCANRKWECEGQMPKYSKTKDQNCKDIARQLIEDEHGRKLSVIMGGGRQCLVSNSTAVDDDSLDNWACYRTDGRNLIEEWKKEKQSEGVSHAVLNNTGQLEKLDTNTEYVLGIFANSHLNYDYIRDKSAKGMPSLEQMTSAALKVLSKGKNGFLLMVEGGLIDFAHHRGFARIALDETIAFDKTINSTIKWLEENNMLEETLVIVTADHDHGLVFNGNAPRGNNILGVAEISKVDGIGYTTLTYGTGGPNNYKFFLQDGKTTRNDPAKEDTTDFKYSIQTGVHLEEVRHGGSDVIIYAKGPMAHLFHNVHEQVYVAHVVAYAAKIGPYSSGSTSVLFISSFVAVLSAIFSTFHNLLFL